MSHQRLCQSFAQNNNTFYQKKIQDVLIKYTKSHNNVWYNEFIENHEIQFFGQPLIRMDAKKMNDKAANMSKILQDLSHIMIQKYKQKWYLPQEKQFDIHEGKNSNHTCIIEQESGNGLGSVDYL